MKRHLFTIAASLALAHSAAAQDGSATAAVRQAMFEAAEALAASVGERGPIETMIGLDKQDSLMLPLDDEQRQNWQFWPTERVGLELALMDGSQRALTHDLLTAALSSRGYLKAVHIMQLERILDMLDQGGLPRSVGHYKVVLFGEPALDGPWAWRFEGHHVSLNVAVSPDGVAVTPSFFGSNPAQVESGPLTGFRVLGREEDLARELLMSLDERQRARAIVAPEAPSEIFTANIRKPRSEWEAWRTTLMPEGIPVAELNEVQQHWVQRIIDEVVGSYRPEITEAYRRTLDPAEMSFAWMGGVERGEPHYFRLQGSDFVFEYDNVQNQGNHVHSVWRSRSRDFGEDILQEHYRSSHR